VIVGVGSLQADGGNADASQRRERQTSRSHAGAHIVSKHDEFPPDDFSIWPIILFEFAGEGTAPFSAYRYIGRGP
jgi:hypothetical protein